MNVRCALYARYSDDLQNDRSVEDQFRDLGEKVQREAWAVVNHYSDHAVSGASLNRPGIQALLSDVKDGQIDVILAESLSRISRDLSDTSHVRKVCKFYGVEIVTLVEGKVGDMEIAFKGFQNQQYLEDLRVQVRRGQRGRVKQGKVAAGLAYGYEVVKRFDANGQPVRGERSIIPDQAEVIQRIFEGYANGKSPKTLAKELNADGIPSPRGKTWNPSTINGHRDRGYGILNCDLYRGKIVWNKVREDREPGTNRRVPRPNPEAEWVTQDAEELRIVSDELWEAVKAKQAKLAERKSFNQRKRPKYLLSNLIECGSCGGGYSISYRGLYECYAQRNKGTCNNTLKIERVALENAILEGLRRYMMEDELLSEFCEEFTRHVNDIRRKKNERITRQRDELEATERGIARCLEAIKGGIEPRLIKDEIHALDKRKAELLALIEDADEAPAFLHPRMADHYKKSVDELMAMLESGDHGVAARSAIRRLIDRIVLTPNEDGTALIVDLHGDLASILSIAERKEKKTMKQRSDLSSDRALVQMCSPRAHHSFFNHPLRLRLRDGSGSRLSLWPPAPPAAARWVGLFKSGSPSENFRPVDRK